MRLVLGESAKYSSISSGVNVRLARAQARACHISTLTTEDHRDAIVAGGQGLPIRTEGQASHLRVVSGEGLAQRLPLLHIPEDDGVVIAAGRCRRKPFLQIRKPVRWPAARVQNALEFELSVMILQPDCCFLRPPVSLSAHHIDTPPLALLL